MPTLQTLAAAMLALAGIPIAGLAIYAFGWNAGRDPNGER